MNFLNSLKTLNIKFLNKFYNKKLAILGNTVGGISGFIFLNEYYTKSIFNSIIKETNEIIENLPEAESKLAKKGLKTNITMESISWKNITVNKNGTFIIEKFEEYYNPFNIFIIDNMPYSINFLITVSVGACFGNLYMSYYPISIVGTVIYNLLSNNQKKKK